MMGNQTTVRGGLICSLFILTTALAGAQERREIDPRRGDGRAGVQVRRVSSVIGTTVSLRENASLGKVEDLVLNESGCVDYLVVDFEQKFILVPWSSARVDFSKRTVTVDIERDRFKDVPTFTREKWPDFSDTQYIERINKFYGVRPGPRGRAEERRDDRRDRRDRPPQ
ncbi:MAG: PRC-barrel domain-containing protein [Gemmataceae bacterium]